MLARILFWGKGDVRAPFTNPDLKHREPDERGIASWYGPGFEGKLTANGERFDSSQMTAAHKTLRFGTVVDVLDEDTGKAVRVRINDRGPFKEGRIIDLSKRAAEVLGSKEKGLANVSMFVVSVPDKPQRGPGV